jgi:hypothetical protein
VNWPARLVGSKYLATTKQAPPDGGTHTPVPERAHDGTGFSEYFILLFSSAAPVILVV